jgi:hypothetical protein
VLSSDLGQEGGAVDLLDVDIAFDRAEEQGGARKGRKKRGVKGGTERKRASACVFV